MDKDDGRVPAAPGSHPAGHASRAEAWGWRLLGGATVLSIGAELSSIAHLIAPAIGATGLFLLLSDT